ncbi:hypothetical protein QL285_002760 [Trifolium repens]|nr:hypothetical protein QL285_002760 [Trifolium repens]
MKKPKIPANTKTKKKRNSGNDEETKDSDVVRNNQFFTAVFHHGDTSVRVWSRLEGIPELSDMLFRVSIDLDAYDVALYASGSDFDAHLYVEHNVSDVKKRVREPKCIGEDSDDSDSDDNDSVDNGDDAHGVHFSDSEDERTIALNDGFDPAPTQKALDNNLKMVLSHPPVKYSGPEAKVDDHEYCSDELGSSDPNDSDEDNVLQRKPPKGNTTSTKANQGKAASDQGNAATNQGMATSSAAAEGQSSHSPIEPLVNVNQSQVKEVIDASQSLFDEILNEMIATILEVNPDDIPKKAKAVRNKDVKAKVVSDNAVPNVKKEKPVRRRQSERQKLLWFKKPIIGASSTRDQPLVITDADDESLTQEATAVGNDSKLGTCFRAMKSWNTKK